jgi:hypothetical protein
MYVKCDICDEKIDCTECSIKGDLSLPTKLQQEIYEKGFHIRVDWFWRTTESYMECIKGYAFLCDKHKHFQRGQKK